MRSVLPLFLAWRFIRSSSTKRFLSFSTWLSVIGLVIGVAVLIIVSSVLNGFEQVLQHRILGMVPQAVMLTNGDTDWQSSAKQIMQNDSNVIGVAPFNYTRGMTSINGTVTPTIVNGIDPAYQGRVSILPEIMVAGQLDSLKTGSHNIVLGKALVDERALRIGDSVSIILMMPDNSVMGVQPKFYSFTLSGVFSVSKDIDNWMSYVNIDDAANILANPKRSTGLRLKLDDPMRATRSVEQASSLMTVDGNTYKTNTWQKSHYSLYERIKRYRIVLRLFLLLIVIVAAFNIVSALVMMTDEKKSQIAILQTYGASKSLIRNVFIAQGLIIGVVGVSCGIMVGITISILIPNVSLNLNSLFQIEFLSNLYNNSLPSKINLLEVLIIAFISICICLLATVYPAITAANKSPIDAL